MEHGIGRRRPSFEEGLALDGRQQVRWARALLENDLPLVPEPKLIAAGRGSANDNSLVTAAQSRDGRRVYVYSPDGHAFMLDPALLQERPTRARWFDPRTGARRAARVWKNLRFDPPGGTQTGNNWVLVLSR